MATIIYSVFDGHDDKSAHYATLNEAKRHARRSSQYLCEPVQVMACTVTTLPRRRLYAALANGVGWAAKQEVVWTARPRKTSKEDE